MFFRQSVLPPPRRAYIRAAAIAGLVVLVGVLGFLILNLLVVPSAVERVTDLVSHASGAELTVARGRVNLLGTVVVEQADAIFAAPSGRVQVGRMRVRLGWGGAWRLWRAVRRGDIAPAALTAAADSPADPVRAYRGDAARPLDHRDWAVWDLVAGAAETGIVPGSVELSEIHITAAGPNDTELALDLDRVAVRHHRGERSLSLTATGAAVVGPTAGRAVGDADPVPVPLRLSGDFAYGARTAETEVELEQLLLPLPSVRTGRAALWLSAQTDTPGGYQLTGSVNVGELVLAMPTVAHDEVGPLDVGYAFTAAVDPGPAVERRYRGPPPFPEPARYTGMVTFTEGTLVVNGIGMQVLPTVKGLVPAEGVAAGPLEPGRFFELDATLPDVPLDRIRVALPSALLGDLASIRADGSFGWEISLSVPMHEIGEMTWTAQSDLSGFEVRQIGASVNAFALGDAFAYTIAPNSPSRRRTVRIPAPRLPSLAWALEHTEHTANQITRWRAEAARQAARIAADPPRVIGTGSLGPEAASRPVTDFTYRYVRLDDMSPWVVRAVLTAEDGDFFFHDGVNFYTLPRALERNVRAREIQLGASTISMQLAKMLFLDQERVVSRKLQEVFLVYVMEQHVGITKERILEIYLNIAEFGPGVFGIAEAADYYFEADPHELTAGEATWLASILPSPKRYHQYYENGYISDGWFERMKSYFDIMLERGRMTEEEYAEATAMRPIFAP